jgi:hypothetical protein
MVADAAGVQIPLFGTAHHGISHHSDRGLDLARARHHKSTR